MIKYLICMNFCLILIVDSISTMNYDYLCISSLCFGLKSINIIILCISLSLLMVIYVSLRTFYSNETYNNVALYRAFHFLNFYIK
mgnify:CR=1 FL=1